MKKKYLSILKFLILLNVLMIPFYLISHSKLEIDCWTKFVAFLTDKCLRFLKIDVERNGNILNINTGTSLWVIEISWDSSGWKSLCFCSALIIATPLVSLKRKIKGLIIILPLLFFLNYFRILSTILLGINYGKQTFDFLHLFLWRALNIIVVPLIWFLWFRREYRIREKHGRFKRNARFSKGKSR